MQMPVTMAVIVRVPMMLVEHLLSEGKVLGERRIVTMLVSAAISPRFGFKGHERLGNVDVKP